MALVQANQSFSVGHFVVSAGEVFDSSDPVVKGREQLFGEIEIRSSVNVRQQYMSPSVVSVETASSDPGSLRTLSKAPLKPSEKPSGKPSEGKTPEGPRHA